MLLSTLCEWDGRPGSLSKLVVCMAQHQIFLGYILRKRWLCTEILFIHTIVPFFCFPADRRDFLFRLYFLADSACKSKNAKLYLFLFLIAQPNPKILMLFGFGLRLLNMACCYLNTNVNKVVLQKLYHIYFISAV